MVPFRRKQTTASREARPGVEPLRRVFLLALTGALALSLIASRPQRIVSAPAAALVTSSGAPRSEAARLIPSLQSQLRENPENSPARATLALAYLQRARETADPSYYDKADALLQRAPKPNAQDPAALTAAGSLALARHRFTEARALAHQAIAGDPESAYNYGVLGDAQIELGEYEAAFESFQQMADRRPDLSALSRVAYARELTGDLPGAIDAMQRAAAAGGPASEATAWVRVQLGHLLFLTGDLQGADRAYRQALFDIPDYAHALAGQGRLRASRRDYSEAIRLYSRATELLPLPEYVIALGEVYEAAGQTRAASRQFALVGVLDRLFQASGVDTDLELALFVADHGDARQAVLSARAARNRRPSVHADDVLAWTAFRAGDLPLAQEASQRALRLGSRDPLLLFHAGLIAERAGDRDTARIHLTRALAGNPRFSVRYADEAAQALKRLQGPAR